MLCSGDHRSYPVRVQTRDLQHAKRVITEGDVDRETHTKRVHRRGRFDEQRSVKLGAAEEAFCFRPKTVSDEKRRNPLPIDC